MKLLCCLLPFILFVHSSMGQVLRPGSGWEDYYKVLELKNKDLSNRINLNPAIITPYNNSISDTTWNIWQEQFQFFPTSKKWIKVINPQASVSINTNYAWGFNDGPQWKGRGINSQVSGGLAGRLGILHFTFVPVAFLAENKGFRIFDNPSNINEYSYPFDNRIDWTIRYGDDLVTKLAPGQSEVRLIFKNATVGFSTQNMTWGPAQYNPIIISNNAQGMPHFDLGTAAPINTKIGRFEIKSFWGQMNESEFYDDDPENDKRYFSGIIFGYNPSFLKGLSFGINRVFYRQWNDDLKAKDIFIAVDRLFKPGDGEQVPGGPLTNDRYDQMASLMLKWEFPSTGFETYVEYARNDFGGNLRDLILEPDHSRAYTYGIIKLFDLKNNNLMKLNIESTILASPKTDLVRAVQPFYAHYINRQGYTIDGQIMGAAIGPGSKSFHLGTDIYNENGSLGGYFKWIRYNDDYYFTTFDDDNNFSRHEVDLNFGGYYSRFFKGFHIRLLANFTRRYNWYFEQGRDQNNLHLQLSVERIIN